MFGLNGSVRTGVLTISQRRRLTKNPANKNTRGKAAKHKKPVLKARKSANTKKRRY